MLISRKCGVGSEQSPQVKVFHFLALIVAELALSRRGRVATLFVGLIFRTRTEAEGRRRENISLSADGARRLLKSKVE
jgi:hypothetical protein